MYSETEKKRFHWHSRRGMLELDLLLLPFFEQHFDALPEEDQQRYVRLLECEDTDLFAWIMGHGMPADPDLQRIVGIITGDKRTPPR